MEKMMTMGRGGLPKKEEGDDNKGGFDLAVRVTTGLCWSSYVGALQCM